ncbi:hypothetical protein Hypma_011940 [Hypsizygus marmoreus]|uniref:Uncharacterized protein n=1 Tax=Hypsizygus marmoreus TaxID=39966 RepID=A0A369JP45_HYPMA|nr:hypothetical protein Hypma_011940 [Hypsizygus marmoreus]
MQEKPSTTSRPHSIRRKKRATLKEREGHIPQGRTYAKYANAASAIETPLVSASLPVMKGAYSARNAKQKRGDKKIWSVDELIREGLSYVHWDGYQNKPLLDNTGTVIAVLVGQPLDEGYRRAAANPPSTWHYPALNVGVTYAKGMGEPATLNDREHSAMVSRLLADEDIERLATFASAAFQFWAPNVYKYYKDHLDPLWVRMPYLRRNFP